MGKITLFDGIFEQDVNKLWTIFDGRKVTYKKERTIVSNLTKVNLICVVLEGEVDLVRYDYNGNRTIIEELEENDVFGKVFSANTTSDIVAISKTDCKILFLDYQSIINRNKRNYPFHDKFIDNMFKIISIKMIEKNERIEVLTQRSIRDKLLAYFENISKKKISKTFKLNITYTDLADYLSIDRSAMMREIKHLKEEGFIKTNGKKITIFY